MLSLVSLGILSCDRFVVKLLLQVALGGFSPCFVGSTRHSDTVFSHFELCIASHLSVTTKEEAALGVVSHDRANIVLGFKDIRSVRFLI